MSEIVIEPVTRIEGHAKITCSARRDGRGEGRPFPRDPVPRVRADLPRPAGARDAILDGPDLRYLPGEPPDRLRQGM